MDKRLFDFGVIDAVERKWTYDDPEWRKSWITRETWTGSIPMRLNTEPLAEEFGRHLDTREQARIWLTNPWNWHKSRLAILRWDGLHVTVDDEHGEQLIRRPWEDSLLVCAVVEQRRRRLKETGGEDITCVERSEE